MSDTAFWVLGLVLQASLAAFVIWGILHEHELIEREDKIRRRRRAKRVRRATDQLVRDGYVVVLHTPAPERDRTVTRAVDDWYGEV